MSVTVENKEVSSARNFGLERKFSVKSLMHKRKNSGPRMETCRWNSGARMKPWTLDLMSVHEERMQFKTTIC